MASGPDRIPNEGPQDTSEDPTLSGQNWPVDNHYYVEPVPPSLQSEPESIRRTEQGGVRAPPPSGYARTPTLVVVLLLLALLLALPAAAWIATRGGLGNATPLANGPSPPPDRAAGGTPPTTTPSTSPSASSSSSSSSASSSSSSSSSTTSTPARQAPVASARVAVPAVVGLRADEAVQRIRARGLRMQIRLARSSKGSGTVLTETPRAGARVAPKSAVLLTIARHAPTVVRVDVPDVVGVWVPTARRKLSESGLEVTVTTVASSQPAHMVLRQSPAAGTTVRKGATVRLTISSGPAQVTVPDVTGLDEATARNQLESAGFTVEVVDRSTSDPSEDGTVTAQNPDGGAQART